MSATTPSVPSVQLWSVRDELGDDPRAALERLAEIGLTAVEPFGLSETADRLAAPLRDLGLAAPTAHASLLDADLDMVSEAARRIGTTLVIEPHAPAERWATRDDVARLADALNSAAERLGADGLAVGYHNHHWETQILVDGEPALLALADALDDRVLLEVDVYWAAVGGADPVALLQRLGPRVAALHVKDGTLDGDTSAQLPVGDGEVPLAAALAAAPTALRVLEFDDYAGDVVAALAASVAGLRRLEAAA